MRRKKNKKQISMQKRRDGFSHLHDIVFAGCVPVPGWSQRHGPRSVGPAVRQPQHVVVGRHGQAAGLHHVATAQPRPLPSGLCAPRCGTPRHRHSLWGALFALPLLLGSVLLRLGLLGSVLLRSGLLGSVICGSGLLGSVLLR